MEFENAVVVDVRERNPTRLPVGFQLVGFHESATVAIDADGVTPSTNRDQIEIAVLVPLITGREPFRQGVAFDMFPLIVNPPCPSPSRMCDIIKAREIDRARLQLPVLVIVAGCNEIRQGKATGKMARKRQKPVTVIVKPASNERTRR